MFEIEKTDEINRLIAITKSDSGISGPALAKAHMELGRLLAKEIPFNKEETTIVSIMRGGIFLAEGMYFEMGCKFQTYDPKHETYKRPDTEQVILVDSVINTGKTLSSLVDDKTIVACCVINDSAISLFDKILYTIRVSKNSFVGADVKKQSGHVGPDTTLRLFNLI